MSDIGIELPWWLLLFVRGVQLWPAVLALFVAAACLAAFTRGLPRAGLALAAIILAAQLAATLALEIDRARQQAHTRADEAATHTLVDRPANIDGLALPAQTAVTWTDPTREHLLEAVLPAPTRLLGVTLDRLAKTEDDSWDVDLATPQPIDDWMCEQRNIRLSRDGRLRACRLAADRIWNEWPIPARTWLALGSPDGSITFTFPTGAHIMAPEIGRALPLTGSMAMHQDGSLDRAYFDDADPLLVHGIKLWNTVTWHYAPDSLGRGRTRPALSVTGAAVTAISQGGQTIEPNNQVTIRLEDGTLLPE